MFRHIAKLRARIDKNLSEQGVVTALDAINAANGEKRSPDFIGIGAEKAGTTWLWQMLMGHPEVGVPLVKELRQFVNKDEISNSVRLTAVAKLLENHKGVPLNRNFVERLATEIRLISRSENAYLGVFGQMKEQVVGEISPQYLRSGAKGIAEMKRVAPDAKILVLLRDPVDRAISSAKMVLRTKKLPIDETNLLAEATSESRLMYSRYCVDLAMFDVAFPGKVFIGFYEDITHNPLKLLQEITKFLGVEFSEGYFPRAKQKINLGNDYSVPKSLEQSVFEMLKDEYFLLEHRFPARVSSWRDKYENKNTDELDEI